MDVNVLPSILKSRVVSVLWRGSHGRARPMGVMCYPQY